MAVTRLLSVDDTEELTALVGENREFLGPWDPEHNELYYTVEGQRDSLRRALEAYAREAMVPLAIVAEDGRLAGRISINGVTRGAFQSAALGYWVSQSHNGRGLATAAVAEAIGVAFKQLGLHACRQRPCCTTPGPSGSWPATGSSPSPSRRPT
jgi:ribosomal-protein-alanine N-acetyltransferase